MSKRLLLDDPPPEIETYAHGLPATVIESVKKGEL
jgi:hypothetical protein